MARTQDPHDKLTEAHRRLAQAVADLVSGDDWQAFLALAAKLHGYSARNVLLILSQAPWATQVAGYRTWQQLGRQVRAGEKGIAILAPCRYRSSADTANGDQGDDDAASRTGRVVVRGFRAVYVFDVSSTDGDALAQPARPQLLRGEAPSGLWDGLAEQVSAEGYTVERGDCGGANGVTRFDTRLVRIRDDVDDCQACRTLAHELGHVLLHAGTEYSAGCRGRAEVEAESVAYVVCSAGGMDGDQYSFVISGLPCPHEAMALRRFPPVSDALTPADASTRMRAASSIVGGQGRRHAGGHRRHAQPEHSERQTDGAEANDAERRSPSRARGPDAGVTRRCVVMCTRLKPRRRRPIYSVAAKRLGSAACRATNASTIVSSSGIDSL